MFHAACPMWQPLSVGESAVYVTSRKGSCLNRSPVRDQECVGDGITSDSAQIFCHGCSECYGICERCGERMVMVVDRSMPFDPSKVRPGFKLGWQDERSLQLEEIDMSRVKLVSGFAEGIPLDAKVGFMLFQHPSWIPASWKQALEHDQPRVIFFTGTVATFHPKWRYQLVLYFQAEKWHLSWQWEGTTAWPTHRFFAVYKP